MKIYAILAILLLFTGTHAAAWYGGGRSEVADHQARMNEAVAALQKAMSKVRADSRRAITKKDEQVRAARRTASANLTRQVNNDETLASCFPVTVRTDGIWVH